ncbi:2-dehydro-3-deoxy-L-rhamnonate dehydrogenase (NAD(+)) [Paraburkholderia aspalathi]|uniref:galactitol-1-phosphate 5-dehydrogenase n=1 Tax=Paraburkholderia aspalathi TaxID=1324617 RepID=UPI00190A3D4B|nr:galactitol-1-phosphate 5-dehydrogenase [Paraburkholderia aspalathi]MBK3843683.1 galactitol-1-phosphate 5-dehydrogenase [Paraburkholderia aspalathi]CAE6832122.1 2-dehydro-3-deoxy-L-rhamnonate dehydrogenase (NAD(+)) [Paraburkholderia aspalathi]CAE6858699.1 2-dehydro-3-deoxy-L-rhamnonate dehydrogenase (NAD(+)) [Paraburkholderia aspalathi]
MKALVYTQPNEMQLLERPYPEAAAGEVVLKIDAVGICGSDMHAYHGHDPRRLPGLVLGHEFAGTIAETRAPHVPVGLRVTGNPLITCGRCDYCLQGRDNLCVNRTMVGMTRPGAFAQYMSIPAASVIEIPPGMPATHAAMTEPAATALHAINLSTRVLQRPLPETRTLVIGGGAIGLLSALLLRSYGCRDVEMAEVNPLRRASAERHAGCKAFDPQLTDTPSNHFDFVLDAVGAKATRKLAMAAVKPGGVIMHIGLLDWESEIDMRKLTLAEISLLGTYTYSMADMRATVAAIYTGAFGDLVWAETRPLDAGGRAFEELDRGGIASSKVILMPE